MPPIIRPTRRIILDGHATLNVACPSCTQDTHTQHTHTQDMRTQAVVYGIKIVHIKFAHINMRATTTSTCVLRRHQHACYDDINMRATTTLGNSTSTKARKSDSSKACCDSTKASYHRKQDSPFTPTPPYLKHSDSTIPQAHRE